VMMSRVATCALPYSERLRSIGFGLPLLMPQV
jgi:hypothetical protein